MPQIPIAIVGVSALFPGSLDKSGFWRDILAGRDLVTDVPASHWRVDDYYDPDPTARDKTYSKRGAFLPDIDFDPVQWGVPPSVVPATDTCQLLALIVAQQVLEDACQGQFAKLNRERASVILGVTSAQELLGSMVSRLQRPVWIKALRETGLPEAEVTAACDRIASHYSEWQESTFPGVLGNVVAGRIANRLNLGGTNCVTDAACASSLSALSMGVNELALGQSDLAIVGGADTMNDIFMYMCFSKTPALSKSGDCRPFSDRADGTLLGEGIGMVAMKRLTDAERDGDRVYAVLRGVGTSSDGRAKSVYAPVAEGQARALRRAYEQAGYGCETVGLVEAHGTGTVAGDAAEFEGLKTVFGETGRTGRWCALGSIKSQVGHTKAAAGAAGLFKIVMALHHKVLPPTIKVDRPNPALGLESSPFYLNTQARPWVQASAEPRRASVSAFGFGGSNFHVALEEYRGAAARAFRVRHAPTELVLLHADSPTALAARCEALANDAATHGMLTFLARTTQQGFDPRAACRLSIVADSEIDLGHKLRKAAALAAAGRPCSTPNGIELAFGAETGDVAFLFPGQGSQYVHMGADVAMTFEDALAAWDLAAGVVPDLSNVVFPIGAFSADETEAQKKTLTDTAWAQPAIGAMSLSLLRVLARLGLRATAFAGHSFGEVTALYAAGALTEQDFLSTARIRGELMAGTNATAGTTDADGAGAGTMTSVVASIEDVRARLTEWGLDVAIANHNGPNQVVLSGAVAAIADAEQRFQAVGVTTVRLDVSAAFHSPCVGASIAPFREALSRMALTAPKGDVYSNATATLYGTTADAMRATLAEQIGQPVRFVEQIEAMYARGVRTFVEVGPGRALTGMVSQILKGHGFRAVALDRKGRNGVTSLHEALGQLAVAGAALDFEALWVGVEPVLDPRKRETPKLVLKLNGANYGKPYPPADGVLPKPNPPRPVPVVGVPAPVAASQPVPMAAPAPAPAPAAWAEAFQESQRQTAEAHIAFQRSMAETHSAFLKTMEASFDGLHGMMGGAPRVASATPPFEVPVPPPTAPRATRIDESKERPMVSSPPAATPIAKAPEKKAETTKTDAPAAALPVDLRALLLQIVAAKTGYPEEMLGVDMDLEADLGVDSIKRVEILAAVRGRLPTLSDLNPTELRTLRTLAQIRAYLEEKLGASAKNDGPGTKAAPAGATVDLKALLLQIVATKTGYPEEMLGVDMDLEADLGVDSIKRVEILAALRGKLPALTEMNPTELRTLRTLAQITAYIDGKLGGGATKVELLATNKMDAASPSATTTTSVAAEKLGRFVVRVVPAAELGLVGAGSPVTLGARTVFLIDDHTGVAPALARSFEARGIVARVVDEVPEGADAVVFLGGLRSIATREDAIAVAGDAHRAARGIARTLASGGGLFVTVQDTGGDFGLRGSDRAWLGGLPGLVKSAAHEWPKAHVRALDVERGARSPEAVAEVLATELLSGGPELELGLRADGTRWTLDARLEESAKGALPIDESSVVVVSGGARGVTARTVIELARTTRARFLLLGRTARRDEPEVFRGVTGDAALKRAVLTDATARKEALTPAQLAARVADLEANREITATLGELRAAGSEARYASVDVTDGAAVRAAIDAVRGSWGEVTGVIHGAGVIHDRLIAEKTESQFAQVFETKTRGLAALLDATSGDPLRFLCAYSSVAARTGNVGQSDYAMANEVLNKVMCAERAHRPALAVVKSLNWGPWAGGMVTPALQAHFEKRGVPLIPLVEGARLLGRELATPEGVEIVLGAAMRPDGLSRPTRAAEVVMEMLISHRTHPYLDDHRVGGVPVLPVASVLDAFARLTHACRPDLVFVECRSLAVLRGIRLTRFQEQGDRFVLRARQVGNGDGATFAVELTSLDGSKHYTATTESRPKRPPTAPATPRPDGLAGRPGPVYGRPLFHGPAFHAIATLDGVSRAGAAATLTSAGELGWGGGFHVDPALLDGGLQLALLWTEHVLEGASLPTALGGLSLYGEGLPRGPVHCLLYRETVDRERAVSDVIFVDGDGRLVAKLRGVETHLLPARALPSAQPDA